VGIGPTGLARNPFRDLVAVSDRRQNTGTAIDLRLHRPATDRLLTHFELCLDALQSP
jgi:hypothetical protein